MDVAALTKLYGLEGPFTTIYLDTASETEDAAEKLEIRWKNVLRDLDQAGVDGSTREALTRARGSHGRGNTRVIVASTGTVHLATSLPQPPAQEIVTTEPLPRLVPLLDTLLQTVPHVVVLADRQGADVYAYTSGPEPEESASITNTRFPQRKVKFGGWATKRFSNDVDESWEASARDVASLVDKVGRDIDARVVIASGDERALQLIGHHLPPQLADRYHRIDGGGRHVDGSEDVIAQQIEQVLSDVLMGDTVALLEKYAEERGQNDRASDGVTRTIESVRMSQVEALILTDARDPERTAWIGPDPTNVALNKQELRDLGVEAPVEVRLDEALVRAALGTGAAVRFVSGSMEQSPKDGVGALLRY
jgi:hypothetical protein